MTLVHVVTSDAVSSVVLAAGIPACAFLTAYAAVIWRDAGRQQVRARTLVCVLTASCGVVISLCGALVADQLSAVAAMAASADDLSNVVFETVAGVLLLWPLGWCLLIGAVLLVSRGRLGRRARIVLAALLAGFAVSLASLAALIVFGPLAPGKVRILTFVVFLVVAIVMLFGAVTGRGVLPTTKRTRPT